MYPACEIYYYLQYIQVRVLHDSPPKKKKKKKKKRKEKKKSTCTTSIREIQILAYAFTIYVHVLTMHE